MQTENITDAEFQRLDRIQQDKAVRQLVKKIGKEQGANSDTINRVSALGASILDGCFDGDFPWHQAGDLIRTEFSEAKSGDEYYGDGD